MPVIATTLPSKYDQPVSSKWDTGKTDMLSWKITVVNPGIPLKLQTSHIATSEKSDQFTWTRGI